MNRIGSWVQSEQLAAAYGQHGGGSAHGFRTVGLGEGLAMRQVLLVVVGCATMLLSRSASAAACPNLSVHPGITTVLVQSDFGEKDAAAKAYVFGLQDAIKKSTAFCPVDDVRTATYALDVAGIDLDEDHERAALSVVIVSEKGTMISHWVRLSSVDNVEKNSKDDVNKVERAIQKAKRQR